MGELITADVLDWARDLAALQRLLVGRPADAMPASASVVIEARFGAMDRSSNVARLG
jgi:hypothetical protein